MKLAVWISRLVLGGVFMLSGVTKMVDPWGTITKIEAYLQAWSLADIFGRGLVLVGGCALATFEFVVGFLLATGSLRRSAAYMSALLMAFMLPLTAYIAIANPVADCGCFGDFLVISNVATFLKNIVLTALAVFLCCRNHRVGGLFAPWVQWAQIAAAVAYMLIIGMIGYHEQPLLDFRPYPVGETLSDSEGATCVYVYERDGVTAEFADDELPDDDSGWEFRDVRMVSEPSAKTLALIDRISGEDVTDEVVASGADKLLLLIPEPAQATAAGSFTANALNYEMTLRHGEGAFAAVTAADSEAVEWILDLMMAEFPVYYADPKAIKSVARGQMAFVYLQNDTVRWKRTLSSINLDRLLRNPEADIAEIYVIDGNRRFWTLTGVFAGVEVLIALIGSLSFVHRRLWRRRKQVTAK